MLPTTDAVRVRLVCEYRIDINSDLSLFHMALLYIEHA